MGFRITLILDVKMDGKDHRVMNAWNCPVAYMVVAKNIMVTKFPIRAIVRMVGWDIFVISLFAPKAVI